MKVTAISDIGRVRRENQDICLWGEFADGSVWIVVCDGMGGANAGTLASNQAAKVISEKIKSSYNSKMNEKSITSLLVSAIENANSSVYNLSNESDENSGMGTTAVAAIINNNSAYFAHVGDSRAYLLSKNTQSQITTDHSVVQTMLDSGDITPQQAKIHPQKNIITRAIGVKDTISVDVNSIYLEDGQAILICSDGLSNMVDPQVFSQIIFDKSFNDPAYELARIANQNGGLDNITVVAIEQGI